VPQAAFAVLTGVFNAAVERTLQKKTPETYEKKPLWSACSLRGILPTSPTRGFYGKVSFTGTP
jgi:hypothetical protein